MAMRLQELHPALVHFPITLLPVAVGADALGKLTGSASLLRIGKVGIALAAGSAVVSAVAGLIAQEEVKAEGAAHDLLVTHRNLNIALVGVALLMARHRARRRRPSFRYLATGAAGIGLMSYTSYLGGHMVYEYGVGVVAADGADGRPPELRPAEARAVAEAAIEDLRTGARHVMEDFAAGEVVPWLSRAEPAPELRQPG